MGYEYRLHVNPHLSDLGDACRPVFASTRWWQIPTSLTDVSDGIGVQSGDPYRNSPWPQIADLYLEPGGTIYIICHNNDGGLFMHDLIENLKVMGHTVEIDDDL